MGYLPALRREEQRPWDPTRGAGVTGGMGVCVGHGFSGGLCEKAVSQLVPTS